MTAGLRLCGVRLWLQDAPLIERLDLALGAGEVATLMGPSGVGKSSLLAFLCGTLDPAFRAEGQVLIEDRDVTSLAPEHRRIGILFQDDLLFPHLSVGGNLGFGLPASLRDRAARRARIDEALVEADMAGFADRDPATLSGGQRARVALMRLLLSDPKLLLLDEPFGKLDADLRERFRHFVFDHAARRKLPVLMVTHDIQDAPEGGQVIRLESLTPSPNGIGLRR
ncbi:MAG: ATP-binding cassette domain-containing protein [Alphaproteobacteria bacterium]|nr:ATP-binding cassette domain-containing protein [Alphaproteobacteria bacterium]MBU0888883.1 ATP-binding cassette domain-containing protein [Alphaproteobacteria bacterium]MBU1813903.1 ATP-binding cassette domain-containing protein [Alphaproteobacteria bacterium]